MCAFAIFVVLLSIAGAAVSTDEVPPTSSDWARSLGISTHNTTAVESQRSLQDNTHNTSTVEAHQNSQQNESHAPSGPASHVVHWSYLPVETNSSDLLPETWQKGFPQCSGQRQSPIGINTTALKSDPLLQPLHMVRYKVSPRNESWTVINNGHVVQFSGQYVTPPEIHNGGLPDDYVFLQFHFHWGATDARGSEHAVDGKRFPLEVHIVHRRSIDLDDEAPKDAAGLAVVGVFFEIDDNVDVNNQTPPHMRHLSTLLDAVTALDQPGDKRNLTLPGFHLDDLLPDSPAYYRYLGSLTTPPCNEAVIWTVMSQPLKIRREQVEGFRSLAQRPVPTLHERDDVRNILVDNYRPVQKLYGREVKWYSGVTVNPESTISSPNKTMPGVLSNNTNPPQLLRMRMEVRVTTTKPSTSAVSICLPQMLVLSFAMYFVSRVC